MERIVGIIAFLSILFFLWKNAFQGLRGNFVLKLKGGDKVMFKKGKAKFYGFLFLIAALSLTWVFLIILGKEF